MRVEEALKKFIEAFEPPKPKIVGVPLDLALGRVLAESLVAKENIPRIDRSAVDGYAVRHGDVNDASQFRPKSLAITNMDEISFRETKQVWTGSPIPKRADAVLMLEHAKLVGDKLEVWIPLAAGENVSREGEDIEKGQIVIETGTRLKPQHLGLVAALGLTEVKVFEKPKIAILTTGNELVEVGGAREGDQIFDVNRHTISALCQELGAEPSSLGIARDDMEEIVGRLELGTERTDAVITSGGTSVGSHDLVPEAVNRLGKPGVIVHGVAMRPAMPTGLAIVRGKPIVMLSGNPVAAMIAFEVFARPMIAKMLRLRDWEPRPVTVAKMTRGVASALGRKTFLRVRLVQQDAKLFARPVSTHGSSIISTMTKANGYVVIPENQEGLEKGENVTVHLFDNVEVG